MVRKKAEKKPPRVCETCACSYERSWKTRPHCDKCSPKRKSKYVEKTCDNCQFDPESSCACGGCLASGVARRWWSPGPSVWDV